LRRKINPQICTDLQPKKFADEEYLTCNKCYEKCKNTQKEIDLISRKKKKLEDDLNEPVPQINTDSSQTLFSHFTNLELLDDIMQDDDNNVNKYDDETDGLLYDLKEIQNIISKQFQDVESLNEPVIFAFEIELDSRLVKCIFLEF
jgi:hypothetical protein